MGCKTCGYKKDQTPCPICEEAHHAFFDLDYFNSIRDKEWEVFFCSLCNAEEDRANLLYRLHFVNGGWEIDLLCKKCSAGLDKSTLYDENEILELSKHLKIKK